MSYRLVHQESVVRVELSAATLHGLMEAAAEAFTAAVTPLSSVQPRLAEELDIDAPDLESLLVDFLSELLYRLDTRAWLTRFAEVEVHQTEDGWTLESTLRGERREPANASIGAISYQDLAIGTRDERWTASVTLITRPGG